MRRNIFKCLFLRWLLNLSLYIHHLRSPIQANSQRNRRAIIGREKEIAIFYSKRRSGILKKWPMKIILRKSLFNIIKWEIHEMHLNSWATVKFLQHMSKIMFPLDISNFLSHILSLCKFFKKKLINNKRLLRGSSKNFRKIANSIKIFNYKFFFSNLNFNKNNPSFPKKTHKLSF